MELRGFVGPSYESESPWASQEQLINWYVEPIESPAASQKTALYPTPGFEELADNSGVTPNGLGRGHLAFGSKEFAVIGSDFVEITDSGVITSRGTVAVDANPATLSYNGDGGTQIFITSGTNGYLYNYSTEVFSQIAALNGIATMGGMLDGYFLCLDVSTSTVFISDLLDGTTWDPLQFFQRTSAPDAWESMAIANRYIYLFGSRTSEVWYDDGSFPVPFVPHPSGLMQFGIAAPFSVEVVGPAIVWAAKTDNGTGGVMRTTGFTPETISNHAIERIFSSLDLSLAIADSYEENGHTFYMLSFLSDRQTWCYDTATDSWHQRGTWIEEKGQFDAQHAFYHAFAFNEHRMLDLYSAKIYRMSNSYGFDVDNRVIRRVRRAPTLFQENKRAFISSFELDVEVGLGLPNDNSVVSARDAAITSAVDPKVWMRYSNDGGKTWGAEQFRSAGEIGEYRTRVKWNRCGMFRRRVFEVAVSDPVPWRIMGAFIEMTPSMDFQGGARG